MDATKEGFQERSPVVPPRREQPKPQTPVPMHQQQAAEGVVMEIPAADASAFSQVPAQEKIRQSGQTGQAAPRQEIADKPTQASIPSAAPVARPAPAVPARELRVKVWEQEETVLTGAAASEDASQVEASQTNTPQGIDDILEDLPTRPVAAPPGYPAQQVATAQPASGQRDVTTGEVEHMSTVPLMMQQPVTPPSRPIVQPQPQARPQSQPGRPYIQGPLSQVPPVAPALPIQGVMQRPVSPLPSIAPSAFSQTAVQRPISQVPPGAPAPARRGGVQQPVSQIPPFAYVPPMTPVQERAQTPPVASEPAVKQRTKSGGRVPVLLGLVVLAVLVVGGLGAWIIIRQPFTVPTSTQPQQAFTSTQLGLSVLYPSGWTAKVNQKQSSVFFSDSSHTGQVNVVVAASGDVTQYLNSEAKNLGMTGVRQGTPLAFAGTSWQVLQGNVQQAGASYSGVLIATAHGNHIYTIVQMAPQAVYSQEDQLVFSPFRSSFHFLA